MASSSQDPPSFHWHFTELDDRLFQIRGHTVFFVIVLFAVILLVTLLFLYARWVCHYHRLAVATASATSSAASHVPGVRSAINQPQGLDSSTINSLPILLYKSTARDLNSNSGSECCICLSLFEEGEKIKVLPNCRHCYHSECVDSWLKCRSSCPLCRVSIRVDHSVLQLD